MTPTTLGFIAMAMFGFGALVLFILGAVAWVRELRRDWNTALFILGMCAAAGGAVLGTAATIWSQGEAARQVESP